MKSRSMAYIISGVLFGAVFYIAIMTNPGSNSQVKSESSNINAASASLYKTFMDYFPIGVAVEPSRLSDSDPHQELISKNFNSLVAENAMKPASLQPTEGNFNFKNADIIVDYAIAHNMKMRGHTLLWHKQIPDWFFKDPKDPSKPASREIVLARMKTHITTVLKHFKEKYGDKNPIYCWDVVNEPLSDKSGLRGFMEGSQWLETVGPDYIEKALEYAHDADPSMRLYINDYNIERLNQKTLDMYDLVKSLLDNKVPIDGIGMQMHININTSIEDIKGSIKKFKSLGIDLQITELDMDLMGDVSDSSLSKQAKLYKDIFGVLMQEKQSIKGVTFWGISDEVSWLSKPNAPLLFDSKLQPKPAFKSIVEAGTEKNQSGKVK